jgi:tungstate transport system substrate-binding protein
MNRRMRRKGLLLLAGILILITATAYAANENVLMMATTTSTDNTGLLDYIVPKFEKDTGIRLKWTATGTGKALKLGENCDVDVLMVHAPAAEKEFVQNGFGRDRHEIMYNDFVIIGPEKDSAGVKGKSITETLRTLKARRIEFVSRGDNSGTHKKELSLWKAADLPVPEKQGWYIQTGQGMLSTINVAAERGGYTMTDRGTYIKYESTLGGNPPLKILVQGDTVLLNQYSAMAVDPAHCPNVKYDLAMRFIQWITSAKAQSLIKEFKLLGKPLFTPNAVK